MIFFTLYQPSNSIRYVLIDERVVLLDLRSGKYLLLDNTASQMWKSIFTLPTYNECITKLADHFKIECNRCKEELNDFIEYCNQNGYIKTTIENDTCLIKPNKKFSLPTVLHAWLCIFHTKRSITRSGFPAVYKSQNRIKDTYINETTSNYELLSKSLVAYRRAENFFSIKDTKIDCLPRSMSLYRFLISVGLKVTHTIGVQRFPFSAHAWVEFEGKAISDSQSFVDKYTEITRI